MARLKNRHARRCSPNIFYLPYLNPIHHSRPKNANSPSSATKGTAHIRQVRGVVNGLIGKTIPIISEETSFHIEIDFASDPALASPTIGITIDNEKGETLTSCGSYYDGVQLQRDSLGNGHISLCFEKVPLFKGKYYVNIFPRMWKFTAFLWPPIYILEVSQKALEIGYFKIRILGIKRIIMDEKNFSRNFFVFSNSRNC